MKAIIFNSGIGNRMGFLTKNNPKCMVKLYNGETIFERQIRILSGCGIKDFIITTGPFKEQLEKIASKYSKLNFCFFIPKHLFFCVLNITYILPHFMEKRKQKMESFLLRKTFHFLYSYYISSVNDIRDICCSHHYSAATFRFFCPLPFCTQWHLRSILRPHILKLFPSLITSYFQAGSHIFKVFAFLYGRASR